MGMAQVLQEDRGRVRVLILSDPERRNPLSEAMSRALLLALEAAEADPGVRAVVLTGAPPAFSAGADLKFLREVTKLGAKANLAHSQELKEVFRRIYTFPKPVIAAVNGPAVAGGAGLVLASDLAVMDEEAKIGFTEVRIGFVAALVAVMLVRHVGEKHARELLLQGKLIGAGEAYRLGLVNEVAPKGQALERALALASQIAEAAPSSLALTKALLSQLPSMGLFEGFGLATLANAWIRETDDLTEGIQAFFEKRKPEF